jgi:hypothetical protein
MSVAVYNHYKRLMQQQQDDEVEIEKVTSLWWDKLEQENIGCKNDCKMLGVYGYYDTTVDGTEDGADALAVAVFERLLLRR